MNDLIEEVKASFEKSRDEVEGDGPIAMIGHDDEPVPGMYAMRNYYHVRCLVVVRRGYRHFAGSSMSTDSAELLESTTKVLLEPMAKLLLEAFADGVMVGHRVDQVVKLCFHFDSMEHLYHDDEFRAASVLMANGFAEDSEVHKFFRRYLVEGIDYLAQITGFTPRKDANPDKIWDLWMLVGNATLGAAYVAGHLMGVGWRERDVLDGIIIATEEDPGGPQGEDG